MPAKSKRRQDAASVTIVKREDQVAFASHGGAWKVAYADFITALMAFFLVLWLINATTEDQRKGLADYFSPTNLLSHNSSGTGQPFGGHTAFDKGALVSDRGAVQVTSGFHPILTNADLNETDTPVHPRDPHNPEENTTSRAKAPPPPVVKIEPHLPSPARISERPSPNQPVNAQQGQQLQEQKNFQNAAEAIRQALSEDKSLGEFSKHLAIDLTPRGLRIQLFDTQSEPMFALGSAQPNKLAHALLNKITPVLMKLSEPVAIDGYTDAAPYPGPAMTNWELSAERANAARRMLVQGGLLERRLKEVTGHADQDLLLPADPLAAANRRIAITILRTSQSK
ncbi:MAG: OmpA family protein [Acetobacteraceae bacterium]|nr:OmpA family protein [Acetobacteraceae bacterium]